jgi:hypothetical protein
MHLSTRITRTVAAAMSVAALAVSIGAGSASAAGTVDPVAALNGSGANADIGYGTSWAGGLVTAGANLEWNENAAGTRTTPQLVAPGNIYFENSFAESRMQIVHYLDAGHAVNDPGIATRDGASKFGNGSFLTTRPVVLGGVNSAAKHVHLNLQKKIAGVWTTVAWTTETF